MWKGATVFLLATLAAGWYLSSFLAPPERPNLPNEYWGPGDPVADPTEVKPYKINVDKKVIDDLNDRLDRTRRLAEPLEGAAWTYGMPSTYLRKVVDYWRKKYDWTKRQALLNKYPQFVTRIQGLDVHFYHVKPQIPKDRQVRVLPLLLVHGWPGSVVEFQKIIPMLTTPRTGEGFVFELVIPSLPGYGFSQAAAKPGLGPAQITVIFKNLMLRLGFNRFYTQGGDWGALITQNLAALYPQHVIGVHSNMCFVNTAKANFMLMIGSYIPSLVVDNEYRSRVYPLKNTFSFLMEESGYLHIQATKPDTVGAGLTDSPAGLAAYILEKFSTWTDAAYRTREDGGLLEKYTMDELIDNLMLYWVTNSIATSQRLYAESFSKKNQALGVDRLPIEVPAACANFPHELTYRPESVLKERFPNIIQFTHPPRGGHFAAFEEPELLSDDLWSFVHKREQLLSDERREQLRRQQDEREQQQQQQQQKQKQKKA